jgi:hypothetical protein
LRVEVQPALGIEVGEGSETCAGTVGGGVSIGLFDYGSLWDVKECGREKMRLKTNIILDKKNREKKF